MWHFWAPILYSTLLYFLVFTKYESKWSHCYYSGALKLDLKALTCSWFQAEKKSVEKVLRILFYMFCFSIHFWLVFSKFVALHDRRMAGWFETRENLNVFMAGKISILFYTFPLCSLQGDCNQEK